MIVQKNIHVNRGVTAGISKFVNVKYGTMKNVDILKNAGHLLHVQPKKDQIMELSVLKLMEI